MLQKARANPRISLKADWEGECLRRLTGIALETELATHATKSVLFDLKRRFKYIREAAEQDAVWSVGYFVSTIGFNEEIIRKYIEKQSIQDRSSDITQEFS